MIDFTNDKVAADSLVLKVEELKKVKNFRNLSLDFLTILTPKNILFLEKLYAFTMNNFEIGNWHFFRLYSTGTTK